MPWIQCRLGILKNNLHAAGIGRTGNRCPIQKDFAGAWFQQAEDCPREGCFAAAGFTNQAESFAMAEFKCNSIHGLFKLNRP